MLNCKHGNDLDKLSIHTSHEQKQYIYYVNLLLVFKRLIELNM